MHKNSSDNPGGISSTTHDTIQSFTTIFNLVQLMSVCYPGIEGIGRHVCAGA